MRTINWEKVAGQTSEGLLTVVVQDATSATVLMVVYMNPEAYRQTLHTGWLTLFSRKTCELRVQGETRGCRLEVVQREVSCEGDALLLLVNPEGDIDSVCHHGGYSCFVEADHIDSSPPMFGADAGPFPSSTTDIPL